MYTSYQNNQSKKNMYTTGFEYNATKNTGKSLFK